MTLYVKDLDSLVKLQVKLFAIFIEWYYMLLKSFYHKKQYKQLELKGIMITSQMYKKWSTFI